MARRPLCRGGQFPVKSWLTRHNEPWREAMSLRWVPLHMVEEYARHNGHADLLRQRIDGRVVQ